MSMIWAVVGSIVAIIGNSILIMFFDMRSRAKKEKNKYHYERVYPSVRSQILALGKEDKEDEEVAEITEVDGVMRAVYKGKVM